jgi:hypothetical protein
MSKLLLAAVAVVIAGGALFLSRGTRPGEAEPDPAAEVVSAEAAASAEDKLSRLHLDLEEARLSGSEVTSLLRQRPEVWSLGPLIDPSVRISGDTLRLSGAVATSDLPADSDLDAIRILLPDTARIDLTGTIRPNSTGNVAVQVYSLEVAGMPIPARYHPMILKHIGETRTDDPDGVTLILPLPGPLGTARVEAGELILSP